jgi:hypothetical protein
LGYLTLGRLVDELPSDWLIVCGRCEEVDGAGESDEDARVQKNIAKATEPGRLSARACGPTTIWRHAQREALVREGRSE